MAQTRREFIQDSITAVVAAAAAGCGKRTPTKYVTIEDLAGNPAAYEGKTVSATGFLEYQKETAYKKFIGSFEAHTPQPMKFIEVPWYVMQLHATSDRKSKSFRSEGEAALLPWMDKKDDYMNQQVIMTGTVSKAKGEYVLLFNKVEKVK